MEKIADQTDELGQSGCLIGVRKENCQDREWSEVATSKE